VAFTVSDSVIDFASLQAGQSSEKKVAMQNVGNAAIHIESDVSGDTLFTDAGNLKFNDSNWADFGLDLATGQSSEVLSRLSIPSSYTGAGVKTGKVIFWANAQ
jgi:hypothetical protein